MNIKICKASVICGLFISLITVQTHAQDSNVELCPPQDETFLQTVNIRRVVDGDTIHTKSGDKIRVIGVNTPELTQKPEPFAWRARTEATKFLERGLRLAIIIDDDNYDQHGRVLAHVYRVNDDLKIQSLAAYLLREGLGFGVARSEHAAYWPCLKSMEAHARQQAKNVWGLKKTPFIIRKPRPGFAIVRSKVSRIQRNTKGAIVYMNNGLNVHIKPKDLSYFPANLNKYKLKNVEARGWISRSKNSRYYNMHISHPDMLVIR